MLAITTLASFAAEAKVTKITITTRESPTYSGQSFGRRRPVRKDHRYRARGDRSRRSAQCADSGYQPGASQCERQGDLHGDVYPDQADRPIEGKRRPLLQRREPRQPQLPVQHRRRSRRWLHAEPRLHAPVEWLAGRRRAGREQRQRNRCRSPLRRTPTVRRSPAPSFSASGTSPRARPRSRSLRFRPARSRTMSTSRSRSIPRRRSSRRTRTRRPTASTARSRRSRARTGHGRIAAPFPSPARRIRRASA